MTPTRRRRLVLVLALVGGVGLATTLVLKAMDENTLYFYSPTEMAEGSPPTERVIRVGGRVADGSVSREAGSMTVQFDVTDYAHTLPVRYTGVLPDLFREGQGVVALGRIAEDGYFEAETIMARHDENYMSPEVAEAIRQGQMRTGQSGPRPTGYGN